MAADDKPESLGITNNLVAPLIVIAIVVCLVSVLRSSRRAAKPPDASTDLPGNGPPERPGTENSRRRLSITIDAITLLVALAAFIVPALITLNHNAWEIRTTQRHDELSVTPLLDIHASNVLEAPKLLLENPSSLDIYILLENNGVGPAVIERVLLTDPVSGREFKDIYEWIGKNDIDYTFLRWRTPGLRQSIKEGKDFELLRVINYEDIRRLPVLEKEKVVSSIHDALAKLKIEVTYRSIYNIRDKLTWTPIERGEISPRIMKSIRGSSK